MYTHWIERVKLFLYEVSGIQVENIGYGGYFGRDKKHSYIVYDHDKFIVVNYYNHREQRSEKRVFRLDETGEVNETSHVVKKYFSQTKPQVESKQHLFDVEYFQTWSRKPNTAMNYFERKGLKNLACLLAQEGFIRFGKWQDDWLAVMLTSLETGKPCGVQRIFPNGEKRNSKGLKKSERIPCVHFGDISTGFNVSEGIATALSVFIFFGSATCALDAHNLPKVIAKLRENDSKVPIFVFGDNDPPGRSAIEKCGSNIDGHFIPNQRGMDWNDIIKSGFLR